MVAVKSAKLRDEEALKFDLRVLSHSLIVFTESIATANNSATIEVVEVKVD